MHYIILNFVDPVQMAEFSTVYARVQAWAYISFLALEIRLQNGTGIHLYSTVLTPGCMAQAAPTR